MELGMFSWAGDTATPAPHVPPHTAPPQPPPPAPSPRNTDTSSKKSCWGRGSSTGRQTAPVLLTDTQTGSREARGRT